ncbi:Uncharacterised protein [Burkholderia pseudomallei]|uniref:hypothetical protein n=1 Tax=Burkholderia pseudomallei TaxID=28450 RepID=UPI000422920D|nr:hypothetical protein [Burkholderia pseudomallei]AIP53376.1 hypothetical protein DR55_3611 [Burkholderia pseudomallei HBPUB10134a]CAJ2775416.1 Uncharacterised protein [Burkholderia pseudomallei]CAJ3129362.1 Uncharacterised protein [Burkholderia pseudomallei]CAJ3430574.1 Uncharacterised protein [Burkholderia pseudomallei]CAJ3674256.1 Uncharacterised protein [Burkholderia pseudomallei]
MTKLGKFALSTSITLVGGWALANLVIRLPVEMPGFLDNGIRAVLRLTGHREFANPDDMEVLAMTAILIASIIVVGVLVALANTIIKRSLARRTAH